MIKDVLLKILKEYPKAKNENMKNHPLALYMNNDAKQEVISFLDKYKLNLNAKTSVGQGAWSHVPWIAILNPAVTNSTQYGYYVVYLFSEDMKSVYLCLGQGITLIQKEFKKTWRDVLENRANIIRLRVPEYSKLFEDTNIKLGESSSLARDYANGPAFYKKYSINDLLDNKMIEKDLIEMCFLYNKIIDLGGVDIIDESMLNNHSNSSIEEYKRYKLHIQYEGRVNTNKIKKKLGYKCQACCFDFTSKYGELGRDFIEAHHLKPYSDMNANETRSLNIEKDFTVLCSNCHRMIHRLDDPSDLNGLKELLRNTNNGK